MDLTFIISNIIYAAICGGFGYVLSRLKGFRKDQNNLKEGLRALLRDRIVSIHATASGKGYITYSELERAQSIYVAYHGLGGNGTGTALIKELQNMPKSPEAVAK